MVEQLNRPTGELAARAAGACSVRTLSESKPRSITSIRRKTMLYLHHHELRPSRVRVAFADGELSFMLSKDATFEDLADRLRDLDERHHGKPVAIEVKLAASPDARRRRLLSGLGRGIGTAAPKGTPDPT
jgi:hypothetical protein